MRFKFFPLIRGLTFNERLRFGIFNFSSDKALDIADLKLNEAEKSGTCNSQSKFDVIECIPSNERTKSLKRDESSSITKVEIMKLINQLLSVIKVDNYIKSIKITGSFD
jgi:hypothetical protein